MLPKGQCSKSMVKKTSHWLFVFKAKHPKEPNLKTIITNIHNHKKYIVWRHWWAIYIMVTISFSVLEVSLPKECFRKIRSVTGVEQVLRLLKKHYNGWLCLETRCYSGVRQHGGAWMGIRWINNFSSIKSREQTVATSPSLLRRMVHYRRMYQRSWRWSQLTIGRCSHLVIVPEQSSLAELVLEGMQHRISKVAQDKLSRSLLEEVSDALAGICRTSCLGIDGLSRDFFENFGRWLRLTWLLV